MGTKECGHYNAQSTPMIGEAGRTGDWRAKRPVIDAAACLAAKAGKVDVPDLLVAMPRRLHHAGRAAGCRPRVLQGLRHLRRGVPGGAIAMVPEAEHGACEIDTAETEAGQMSAECLARPARSS